MQKKKCLIVTGGGDCPGLNAVIRAVVHRAEQESDWEIWGSYDAFNGLLEDEMRLVKLDKRKVAGIHFLGGTIIGTTNKGGPFNWPVLNEKGNWVTEDRSDLMLQRLQELNIEAVINIGGDGSQAISQQLFEKGVQIIGVPKTIDNDLSATDMTFGYQTAVETATQAVDKLVTTAASHHRIFILEVMGRNAGWIALNAAIAGGAEVCLIPEIPYNIDSIVKSLKPRSDGKRSFANIVIAEGARPVGGKVSGYNPQQPGYANFHLSGAGHRLAWELEQEGVKAEVRVSVLGHLQRGGIPIAFDRVLATSFGVKAFEMVLAEEWGKMVAYKFPDYVSVPIKDAIAEYNYVDADASLIHTARGVGISLGE
ncbi:MAG: ATP-dependent 6-phosphofructokinase [Candidatus Cloacimonetes bacterium]|nr:ATP-dependent 6-phosphofructokinase [Candidatus Cloacimonadota bacterium]